MIIGLCMLIETVLDCMGRALEVDGATARGATEATKAGHLAGRSSVAHRSLILELETA